MLNQLTHIYIYIYAALGKDELIKQCIFTFILRSMFSPCSYICVAMVEFVVCHLLSGVPDYFGRNKISSGGDLSHYSSASLY